MASSALLASVVVPVHNAQATLAQCLDSLLAQTYGTVEVVCVDDGSTDGSAALLADYAGRDGRVRVVPQANAGPGVARNRGIDEARGEYLYFCDADDWCDERLLELAIGALEAADADLATFPYREFDERVQAPRTPPYGFLRENFPGAVVSWRDNPDWIFQSFQNFPWNKVLRTSFVREHHLRYQEIHLTEDLMFAAPALVLAERIAVVDEPLVYHRQGTGANTMAKKDAHPLDFVEAFAALRAFLQEQGLYDELQVAYVNWAAGGCAYNLHTLNTYEAYLKVYRTLAEGAAEGLGLYEVGLDAYQVGGHRELLEDLKHRTAEEHLFRVFGQASDERDLAGYFDAIHTWERDAAQGEGRWLQGELEAVRGELAATQEQLATTQAELDATLGRRLRRVARRVLRRN